MIDGELRHDIKFKGLESYSRFYSRYRGVVYDNKDPDKAGKVQLKVPQLYGDSVHDYWAKPIGIPNGNNEGQFWIPAIGTNVWVSFENGWAAYPCWEHGFWGTEEEKGNIILASLYDEDGSPTKRQWTTAGGQTLLFDDKNKITEIIDANGQHFKMDDSGIHLTTSKNIELGGSSYKSVLGDTMVGLMKQILQQIQLISVSSFGAVPNNASAFAALALQLDTMLSQYVTLK